MKRLAAAIAVLMAALVTPAAAQAPQERNVQASLHASRAAIAPGERFTVVLEQDIREGWHTYWRNPGDSGEPVQLTWTLPSGFSAGELQFPAPHAIPFAILVNYGYSGRVFFPVEITAPANLRPGQNVTLNAEGYFLVCADVCIPETHQLTLTLPVEAQGRNDATWAPRIADAVAHIPQRDPNVTATITTDGRLSVTLRGAESMRNLRFFPFDRNVMANAEAQHPRVGPAGASFTLKPGVSNTFGQAPLQGEITFDMPNPQGPRGPTGLGEQDWVHAGVEIEALPGEPIAGTSDSAGSFTQDYPLLEFEQTPGAAASSAPLDAVSLLAALGLAFIGGLILNIMPCVLPVLSVKALSFAGGAQTGTARRDGIAYFAGVMAMFLALAAILIALRSAGEAVGWGFQLQAPWVTSALALLFFAIGLNLLGVFEFGGSLQNAGGGLTQRGGAMGAFFTGALAVVAATPCTAPFMASAIGVALTQSAGVTLIIFAALALGFALPLTLLHFVPGLQRRIPKPGPWMERAKQVLAFPMFAAAIWLAWVLAEQAGAAGVQSLLNIAAALAFMLFVARWGRVWLIVGAIVLVGTLALSWRPVLGMQQQAALVSEPWSAERLAELRAEGRPVFVNFTAAWCITCKANELSTLSSPRMAQAFADNNVAYLEGDWTNRDEAIASELARHGRAGVPLYLYYPASGDERVLPQVLSESLLLETIQGDAP